MDILNAGITVIASFLKHPAEKLGEKTTTEWNKFWRWFNEPHEATEKKMKALANQNPEFKQDIINLVKAIEKEYPTKFQSMDNLDGNKSQETKTEKNNTVIQGNNISGGNVGNSGGTQIGTQIGTQNNTTYNTHNTNI